MRRVLVVVALLGATAWLLSTTSVAVLASSSMEPWGSSGDLLVHREVPATAIVVDDVVTVDTPDRGLVTHRVVDVIEDGGYRAVVLRGDASPLPDPGVVALDEQVDRVWFVVPRVGAVLRVGTVPLLLGAGLLGLGVVTVRAARRGFVDPLPPVSTGTVAAGSVADPTADSATAVDPRVEALLATCEQLEEDGLAPAVLVDLVRVRTAALLRLPAAERSGAVLAADDGVRFYVLALADADPDAIGVVPPGSARRRDGTAAIDAWWAAVADAVPVAVTERIDADLQRWALATV